MWRACVQQRNNCVFTVTMNEPSHPVHLCVCAFVCGSRMIHLAVLLAAAVSSNLIRRETERESIFFTSSPWVVYESTNCLFDCLNKWHKANEYELPALCQLVWLSPFCSAINHPDSSHSTRSLGVMFYTVTQCIFILHVGEIEVLGPLGSLIALMQVQFSLCSIAINR